MAAKKNRINLEKIPYYKNVGPQIPDGTSLLLGQI
jgi:hypothetical protein